MSVCPLGTSGGPLGPSGGQLGAYGNPLGVCGGLHGLSGSPLGGSRGPFWKLGGLLRGLEAQLGHLDVNFKKTISISESETQALSTKFSSMVLACVV